MNLILNLPPETEARLRQAAAESGRALEALALEALDEKLSTSDDPEVPLPLDRWQKKFRDALAALPRSAGTFVDDSRESIYEGRGE
jgi:plasmid stability protein